MEQQLINAGGQIDLSRIPLWSGTKDSAFTAEPWIKRIDIARGAQTENWNDQTTMFYVLRGDVLIWHDTLITLAKILLYGTNSK